MTILGAAPRNAPSPLWPRVLWVLRIFVAVAVLVAVARALGRADMARGLAAARAVGWPLAFVLAGVPLAMGLDAWGWWRILRCLGVTMSWHKLARIRLSSEVLVLALPAGAVMAEGAKLALFLRAASDGAEADRAEPAAANDPPSPSAPASTSAIVPGSPWATGAASLAIARCLHIGACAVYLGLVAVAAIALAPRMSPAHRPAVLAAAIVGTVLQLLLFAAVLAFLRRGNLVAWMQRLPFRRLRAFAARALARAAEIDGGTRRFFGAPRRVQLAAAAPYVLQWLSEGVETAFILALLGAGVGVGGSLVIDGLTSVLRAAAVIVPAGLGIQEATQLFLLDALGARDATVTAAALIFIKRIKELFWIVTGASLGVGKTRAVTIAIAKDGARSDFKARGAAS